MSTHVHPADLVVARLAHVRDADLASERGSEAADALFERIVTATQAAPSVRSRRAITRLALATALVAALLSAIPALGVVERVSSFFAGWHDPDAPVPTASDVVLASGTAGVEWRIVATTSDRGLCLGFLDRHPSEGWMGSAACGPTDVRGDPWNDDAGHWIEAFGAGGGGAGGLNREFVWGRLARGVASLQFLMTDGSVVRAKIVEGPARLRAPIDYYWASWRCDSSTCTDEAGPFVSMAIARDEDGRVLERRRPVWNGNPTGDPDGPAPPLE